MFLQEFNLSFWRSYKKERYRDEPDNLDVSWATDKRKGNFSLLLDSTPNPPLTLTKHRAHKSIVSSDTWR